MRGWRRVDAVIAAAAGRPQARSRVRPYEEGRILRRVLAVYVYLSIAFLVSPIVVIVASALTATDYVVFPPQGLSLRWFKAAASNAEFTEAFWLSLGLAMINAAVSTALGMFGALAISRYRFRGRDFITTFLLSPLMVPAIVLGVALLQLLAMIGLLGTFFAVLTAHLLITVPYAVRLIAVSFSGFDWNLHWAAVGLGATPVYAFRRVVLPLIRPGLVGAATFSFILSFDEVTISLFATGPRFNTLPVMVFRWAEYSYDPIIAAASAIMVGVAAIAVVIIQASVGLERVFGHGARR